VNFTASVGNSSIRDNANTAAPYTTAITAGPSNFLVGSMGAGNDNALGSGAANCATDPVAAGWTNRHNATTTTGADTSIGVASATKNTAGGDTGQFNFPASYAGLHVISLVEFVAAVAPTAPTALTVTTPNTSQMNLSWTAAANGGQAIVGYRIERETPTGGGFSDLVANTGTNAVTYNNTGLTANVQYNYRVSAINRVPLLGAASTAVANNTLAGVPGQVTALAATLTNSTSIHLAWTAPASSNGSAVAGYRIERESPIGGGFADLVANTTTTAVAYDNNSLAAAVFNYRVSAINGMGLGAASAAASNTTVVSTGVGILTGAMMGPPFF
jgi:hypothetical protein